MTISPSGPISVEDIATEYGLQKHELRFDVLSKIGRLPNYYDLNEFKGTSYNDIFNEMAPSKTLTGTEEENPSHTISGSSGIVRALVKINGSETGTKTSGTIYEFGGGGSGMALYVIDYSEHNGGAITTDQTIQGHRIYGQYGDGNIQSGTFEVAYLIPTNWTDDDIHEIIFSMDCRNVTGSLAKLYVDGVLVSHTTRIQGSNEDVGGTDEAGTGQVYDSSCLTRLGGGAGDGDTNTGDFPITNGSVVSVQLFKDRITRPSPPSTLVVNATSNLVIGTESTPTLDGRQTCIITACIGFDKTDTGIIYESGGTGRGLALYIHGGKIYLEAGDGALTGGTISTNWTIPDKISSSDKTEVSVSVRVTNVVNSGSRCKMYINSRLVSDNEDTGSLDPDMSGSDAAGTGQTYSSLRYCTGLHPLESGSTTGGEYSFTGTIHYVQIYSDAFE